MVVTTCAFAVLLPPSTPWLRNRLLIDLRRQLLVAGRGGMQRVRSRFECGARDLVSQINALAPAEPELKREALRWLLLVLEVGNSVIDLRKEIAALPVDTPNAKSMSWRASLRATCDALIALIVLFDAPRANRFDRALCATVHAISAVQQTLTTMPPASIERDCLRGILSHLHFIRTALLDPQSPLGPFISRSPGASERVPYAT